MSEDEYNPNQRIKSKPKRKQPSTRQQETEEAKQQRLERNRQRTQTTRQQETEEAKQQRLERDRQRTQTTRQQETEEETEHELHQQKFFQTNLEKYLKKLDKFKLIHCEVCRENWPRLDHNPQCKRCTSEIDQPHFGKSNGMVRDHTAIPMNIRLLLDELTMVEEMLLSPILPIMTVVRLATGEVKSKGHVANFRQDTLGFIKEIPRLPSTIPIIIIKRASVDNSVYHCKVNRNRVEEIGKWLIANHPGFKDNGITWTAENAIFLPDDGFIGVEMEDTGAQENEQDVGPIIVESDTTRPNDENEDDFLEE